MGKNAEPLKECRSNEPGSDGPVFTWRNWRNFNPSSRVNPSLKKGYPARGADPADYRFHVNAYKHLTAKGLPAAVIQPGLKSNPGSCKEALIKATFTRTRFHDLETASKTTRYQRAYTEPIQPLNPIVYVKAIFFSGLCASSVGSRFDQTWVRRLSSSRPNPESSFGFSLRYSAGAYGRESQHFKTSLPVYCGMALGL